MELTHENLRREFLRKLYDIFFIVQVYRRFAHFCFREEIDAT